MKKMQETIDDYDDLIELKRATYSEQAPIRFWAWGGAMAMFLKSGTSAMAMFF